MYIYNRGFVPPRSSGDPNQPNTSNQPGALVPTQPAAYGTGFVEYNQHPTGFMNLLNQPFSWDPNLYGWNPNQKIGGFANSSQPFGSTQSEPTSSWWFCLWCNSGLSSDG
ncbi:hypothetical protein Hanom_Chr13g01212951 [Helianthus anomalus]